MDQSQALTERRTRNQMKCIGGNYANQHNNKVGVERKAHRTDRRSEESADNDIESYRSRMEKEAKWK